jgi:hypothetical protein
MQSKESLLLVGVNKFWNKELQRSNAARDNKMFVPCRASVCEWLSEINTKLVLVCLELRNHE